MSFFGISFGQSADIDIILDNQDDRKMAEIRDENGRKERHYLFFDGESVTGKVNVTLHRKTNRLEHQGIKIEFIGQIELYYDRGNHHEFLSLVKELARPGDITQNTSFDFEFNQVEKPYECYTGANVRLRYFLRVTIVRRITDMTKEMDILVHTLSTYPEMNNPIKMEVGIEECLHIEFEYNKSKYHLKDVIVGKIYFLLVRIKIKHMEVAIIKRETTGSGPNISVDSETIAKYEIMDGAPVKGESIPIRVFLAGYDLTPTMRDINKKFSVKYYLNLVLVDEEERRYFKQQEITLWRKSERPRKMMYHQGQMVPGYPAGMHPGYMQGSMVPHALARHNPGDHPSQNVRTAPTPSGDEPVTPSVDYPTQQVPIPGPSVNAALQAPRAEENQDSKDQEIESGPVPSPPVEVVAKPQTPEPRVVDGAGDAPSPASAPVEAPVAEPVTEKEDASFQQVVNSVSELKVNDGVEDEDDDDRPRPPDDDTVPDMEDSLDQGNSALDEDLSNTDADGDDLFSSTVPALGVKDITTTPELGNDDL